MNLGVPLSAMRKRISWMASNTILEVFAVTIATALVFYWNLFTRYTPAIPVVADFGNELFLDNMERNCSCRIDSSELLEYLFKECASGKDNFSLCE